MLFIIGLKSLSGPGDQL